MKITKDFEGLIKTTRGRYVYPDELIITDDSIDVDLDDVLVVAGDLSCDGGIFVRAGLEVMGEVFAKGNITVGWDLRASESIKCDEEIVAVRGKIFSGGEIVANRNVIARRGVQAAACIKVEDSLCTDGEIIAIDIAAGGGIIAGGFIWAYWDIVTEAGIVCEGGVYAGRNIDCKKRIFSGVSIFDESDERGLIRCGTLKSGTICAGKLEVMEKE